jgi:hypothetical protein
MAQPNVPSEDSTVDESPTQAAYEALLAEIAAVPEDRLLAVNVDVVSAVTTVLGVLPELTALRPQIQEELQKFDLQRFDKLQQYALAFSHANTLHRGTFPPKGVVTEMGDELTAIRDRLLAVAVSLAAFGLIDPERIKDVKKANGYRPTAADVFTLVEVFKERWPQLENKTPITLSALNDAGKRAVELLAAVGVREQGPATAGETALIRQKAFTLFLRTYEDARRAVAYLRAEQEDADDVAPSLYANRGRRSREGAGEEPTSEPAESGTQTAAVTIENSTGLPVTNPCRRTTSPPTGWCSA